MSAGGLLALFRAATAPTTAEVARLRAAVDDERIDAVGLLRELPDVEAEEVMRLVSAVRRRREAESVRGRRRRWAVAAGVGILCASAAGLVAGGAGALVAWRAVQQPAPLAMDLASAADLPPERIDLSPGVELEVAGHGTVAGTTTAPEVRWSHGTLGVEVEPGRGLQLSVVTREARVRVIGTGFSVRRDALGTEIAVAHGEVEVACAGEGREILDRGRARTCLPTTPAGLLARAHAQRARGEGPRAVLDTLDLAAAAAPPVDAELLVLRLQALIELGERARALELAAAWLGTDRPERRPEILGIAAALAFGHGGCPAARPYLTELGALGAPVAPDLAPCAA